MSKLYILNGPAIGKSFNLREGVMLLGRGFENDIRIDDKTLSRNHMKILMRGGKYFITDLRSRNGTYFKGEYLNPGIEVEVEEGVPIVLGVTVICLGEGCEEQIMPSLDSMDLANETSEVFLKGRDRSTLIKLEFLRKVSKILKDDFSKKGLEKIIDHIFGLMKRIDRVAFVIIDPETKEIVETVYRRSEANDSEAVPYCEGVVNKVIETGKPIVISDAKTEKTEFSDTLGVLKIESVMCLPLLCHSQVQGVIYIDSLERAYGFRTEDLYLLLNLGQRIAPSLEDIRFASEISNLADDLSDWSDDN